MHDMKNGTQMAVPGGDPAPAPVPAGGGPGRRTLRRPGPRLAATASLAALLLGGTLVAGCQTTTSAPAPAQTVAPAARASSPLVPSVRTRASR